eukprot:1179113-Prorocentrum_minimum.AAC.1
MRDRDWVALRARRRVGKRAGVACGTLRRSEKHARSSRMSCRTVAVSLDMSRSRVFATNQP